MVRAAALRMAIAASVSAVALSSASPVSAESVGTKGNALLIECENQTVTCFQYLLGTWDGLVVASFATGKRTFCTDEGVNAEQLRLMFLKYAGEHPEYLNNPAAYSVAASLMGAYPCAVAK